MHVRQTFFMLLLFLNLPSSALAADKGCGRDTDRSGAVDNWCVGTCDEDFDGHLHTGAPCNGDDCNDHAFFDYPGQWVDAGSGNVKKCQTNGTGTYTAPVTLANIACNPGSGLKYYVSATGVTTAGCGAIGNPCDWRCFFSSNGLACSTSLAPDACVVQRGGSYTSTYVESGTTHHMYFLSKNGTSGHLINWIAAPGESVTITGAGSSPNQRTPIELSSSNYFSVRGSDVPITIVGNFAGSGLFNDGGQNVEFANFDVYNVDGAAGGNIAGVKHNGTSADNWTTHHFFSHGNYMRADVRNENNTEFVIFKGTGWSVLYGTMWSNGVGGFIGLKLKHSESVESWTMRGLVIDGEYGPGLELLGGGGQIDTSFFLSNAQNGGYGVALTGGSGFTHFESDTIFEHNLIYDSAPIKVYDKDSDENSSTFGNFLGRNNIFVDTRPSAYPVGGVDGFIGICRSEFAANTKCSDALYTNVVTGGKIIFTNNCEWTVPEVAPYYDVFGDNLTTTKGNRYASFAAWVNAGWDTGSYNENPLLNGINLAQAPHCSTFGPQMGVGGGDGGGGGGTPDPGNMNGDGIDLMSKYIGSWE